MCMNVNKVGKSELAPFGYDEPSNSCVTGKTRKMVKVIGYTNTFTKIF